MISLDQVLLLEQKVESAVAKITQLNAENAALRNKCTELTNALSAKTEQFSSFQSDQSKIEEGILKALERLNTVENAVHAAAAATANVQAAAVNTSAAPAAPQAVSQPVNNPEPAVEQPVIPTPSFEGTFNNSFDTAAPVQTQDSSFDNADFDTTADASQSQLQIF